MGKRLEPQKVEALGRLNEYLAEIERRILNLGLEFKAEILALEPHDWELDVTYEYTLGDEHKASWIEFLKSDLEGWQNRKNKEYCGLADGEDHNVSRAYVSGLERQKHCYLLHQLYDDFHLRWDEILSLEWIWLDFELWAQFEFGLEKRKGLTQIEKRLIEIEGQILSKIETFQRKARRRVFSGEPDLYDYELTLRLSFYENKGEEMGFYVSWENNIKHRNPIKDFLAQQASRFLRELELVLEDMGLEAREEELTRFNHLSVDLVLRYQYRFPLKGAY